MGEGLAGAIPVDSVAEEYQHLDRQGCACGGRYRPRFQALLEDDAGHRYDRLEAECARCGARRTFLFDISAFYGPAVP
jgi:hypothetical protein